MATTQTTFKGSKIWATIVTVKVNGGSLLFEKQIEGDWVAAPAMTADGIYKIDTGAGQCRFTPSGGCAFEYTQ